MIRMLTRPVGPPAVIRSSMSAGWSWTQALAWICRSAWRASLGDCSYIGGRPALAAATLRSHCSVCGSITGVKAAGRLAVVEVMAVLALVRGSRSGDSGAGNQRAEPHLGPRAAGGSADLAQAVTAEVGPGRV